MYERFSDAARDVLQLSNREAQRFQHEYVNAEHILIAMTTSNDPICKKLFEILDLEPRKIKLECEKLMVAGPDTVTSGTLEKTPLCKRVLEHAIAIAGKKITPAHLMIGLLRERDGVAAQVLMNLGAREEKARQALAPLLTEDDAIADDMLALGKALLVLVSEEAHDAATRQKLIRTLEENTEWRRIFGSQLRLMLSS